jgi:hypothetical protein
VKPREASVQAIGRVFGSDFVRRLNAVLEGFDGVTERVRRLLDLPFPIWRPALPWNRLSAAEGKAIIDRLKVDGVATIPNFWSANEIARIHLALDRHLNATISDLFTFSPSNHYYSSRQPLAICEELAFGGIDPDVLNIIGGYLRRTPFLSESDFRRVLPMDVAEHENKNAKFAQGYSSSHWHHDVHGREIKVLVYLSDVGPGDQNFAFCRGSHKGFRSVKYDKSRFSDERVAEMGHDIVECYGTAGTALIFDSNGIHRLRRSNTRVRDCVTYYYRPNRMLRSVPQQVHPAALEEHLRDFERFTIVGRSNPG